MTEAQQYRIMHRGGVTGRAWKVLGLGWIDDRDQAHHRADRRRKDAPEETRTVYAFTVASPDRATRTAPTSRRTPS